MQLPKLTPLQARLLAFATTTCLVVVFWICFQPHHFAYAAEIPLPPEHGGRTELEASIPPALPDDPPIHVSDDLEGEHSNGLYLPDFAYFDRSLVGRQDDLEELNNNQVAEVNIMPNTTQHFRFKKSQLSSKSKRTVLEESVNAGVLENASNGGSEHAVVSSEESKEEVVSEEGLDKRQAQARLWISANTCRQPTLTARLVTDPPPQLTLWVSTSTSSANAEPSDMQNVTFDGGYANFSLSTDQDVFIDVTAPSLPQGWNGSWHFQLAASVDDGYYHNYDNESNFIYMIDTDSHSALFITHNLTSSNDTEEVDKWKKMKTDGELPFTMYAFPGDNWNPMMGLERSYCGLREQSRASNNLTVNSSITTNFGHGTAKGQFHIQGLKKAMNYTGFLAVNGSTQDMTLDGTRINAGGQVFKAFQWTTKADDSCKVIFDLETCDSVAYAVPSSPEFTQNATGLKALYDAQAAEYMENFRRSLAQVACDTASTAQYSLARTCKDCENDYKAWLCSVLIPRCEDWSAADPWLHPRNINTPFADGTLPEAGNVSAAFNNTMRNRFAYNQSRNTMIDEEIKPGPYKELLPCENLCFDIVRSCPAQLGFDCPDDPMRALSYGKKDSRKLTCNYPGAVVDLNQDRSSAAVVMARWGEVVVVAALTAAACTWV